MRSPLLPGGLAVALAALGAGCASGGRGNHDAGRDVTVMLFDVAPGTDAPIVRADTPPGPDTGGTDTGSPDTGSVGGCTSAGECSDGNACNGIERCELGRCVAGTALTCDDGVACTVDSCSGGSCSYVPNDAFCLSGQRCTSTGCMSTTTGSCNPVTQVGCSGGQACTIFNDGAGGYVTDCSSPIGAGLQYDYCIDETDCAPGHACIDPDGLGTACLHWCNVSTGAGCSGGFSCYGFTDPVVVAGVQYGVCA